ncbi:MAG: hypothetical protein GX677_09730 [Treponema sp.]|nr:hypothetical protein [Treponema sp.]
MSDNKSSFDKLVEGLDSDDRKEMLQRINSTSNQSVQFIDRDKNIDDSHLTISLKLKNETAFYKFVLWLRSFFSKKNIESLYNDDLISNMASKIRREHPGLINQKEKLLDNVFYERLLEMKNASDFFKPYFSILNQDRGNFYVFLSSFVCPELTEKINSEADPFTLTFEKEDNIEVKNGLLKKLDEILKDMNPSVKNKIYSAIINVNWLYSFVSLPYLHFISQFTSLIGNNYTCPYNNSKNDYDAFARVFDNVKSIENEVLESIYLFSQKKELKNAQQKDVEKAVKDFLNSANYHFASIQMYISIISTESLGKIIHNDYNWTADNIDGVEAWFPLYRAEWRRILDLRWNEWLRERKKNQLGKNLKINFNLDNFPVMEYLPWKDMWISSPFSFKLTGGMLSWFYINKYDSIIQPLHDVVMEGIFLKSDNRKEYSEGLNLFATANEQVGSLLEKLSPKGTYGEIFNEFSGNKVRSFQMQNQIDSMIASTEAEIKESTKMFIKGANMIDVVFHGIFDETKDGEHEGLQNIMLIKGNQNRIFRDKLVEIRHLIKLTVFYLTELIPIDASTEKI